MRLTLATVRLLASAALVFALIGAAHAAPPTPEQVERYLRVSGMEEMFQWMPQYLEAQAQMKRLSAPDPGALDRMFEAVMRKADSATMMKRFGEYLLANADAEMLAEQIRWYDSPDGRAVVSAVKSAHAPDRPAVMREYVAGLRAKPPSAARVQLIQRIEHASRSTEVGLQMMAATLRGFAAVDQALGVRVPAESEMEAAIERHLAANEEALREEMLLSALFTYRELADEVLERYYRFLSGAAAQRYIAVASKGLVLQLSQVFVEAFGEARPESAKAPEPPASLAPASPLEASMQRFVGRLLDLPEVKPMLSNPASRLWLQANAMQISAAGLPRLDDVALEKRAVLLARLATAAPLDICVFIARGNPNPSAALKSRFMGELGKLPAGQADLWFDLALAAIAAELRKDPMPELTNEATAAAFAAFFASLPADAAQKVDAIFARFDAASDNDACWATRTIYSQMLKLEAPHKATLIRVFARQ